MTSDVGVEITRGRKDLDKLKRSLVAAALRQAGARARYLDHSDHLCRGQACLDVLQRIVRKVDFQVAVSGRQYLNRLSWSQLLKRDGLLTHGTDRRSSN
jgi:hypothetical protein